MQQITITLSQAQILNLWQTPVILAPAPGTGLCLVPIAIAFKCVASATPYTAGSPVYLYVGTYTNNSRVLAFGNPYFCDALGRWAWRSLYYSVSSYELVASTDNLPIYLYAPATPFADAGPPIPVTLFYGTAKSM